MKKPTFRLLALACALLSGCNPNYYIPNTQNAPLISAKGETNLTVSGNANQVEFQGAYGAGNNFSIQLNGGLMRPKDQDNGDGGSGKFVEAGLGYFKPLQNNFVFETYGLFGLGSVENHFPSTTTGAVNSGKISANLMRYGIQPVIGYKSKYFSVAGSARVVNLNYSNISGNLIYQNEDQRTYLENHKSNFLIEPALTLRGGIEKVKIQLQFVKSLNLSDSDFKQDTEMMTVGLNFKF